MNFKINWKVFILSFAIQFIINSLLFLGVKTPEVLSFLRLPKIQTEAENITVSGVTNRDPFEKIITKLNKVGNGFSLKRNPSLVQPVLAGENYEQASGYIVVNNNTGEILAEKNPDKALPIASLTKLMTAVVALDLAEPAEYFKVTKSAASIQPTKIGVVVGEKMSLEELLQAALMTSANDAVEVIKQGVNNKYGEEVFIRAMNEKAHFLGLQQTSFDNPQGFDGPANFSSPVDLAMLTHYSLSNYPLIQSTVSKDYQFLEENSNHKQFDLYNWNGLLGVYPGVAGVKIGNTDDAGTTTIINSNREGKSVTVVLLGAPGILERDLWTSSLLDLGFKKLGVDPVGITESQLQEKYSTWKYWN